MGGWKIENAQAMPDPNAAHQSPVDAIARTLDMHRDEQLCGFLGDMSAARRSGQMVGHFPVMLSRSQAEAIEQWLVEQGYSAFGKRASGDSAPVTKAA